MPRRELWHPHVLGQIMLLSLVASHTFGWRGRLTVEGWRGRLTPGFHSRQPGTLLFLHLLLLYPCIPFFKWSLCLFRDSAAAFESKVCGKKNSPAAEKKKKKKNDNQQTTVTHFGENKRLHLESSKQNYYIISF